MRGSSNFQWCRLIAVSLVQPVGAVLKRVWSSGYDVSLTRWRSPVRSWVPVWFHLLLPLICKFRTQFYQKETSIGHEASWPIRVAMKKSPQLQEWYPRIKEKLAQLLDEQNRFHAYFLKDVCFGDVLIHVRIVSGGQNAIVLIRHKMLLVSGQFGRMV